jgi:hypothetical protein
MSPAVATYIKAKHIDSLPKLQFLLFLHKHPNLKGTSQEFALHSYLGSVLLVEKIISDLQCVGLVECVEERYQLHNESDVQLQLQDLAKAFEHPLDRLELIDTLKQVAPLEGVNLPTGFYQSSTQQTYH